MHGTRKRSRVHRALTTKFVGWPPSSPKEKFSRGQDPRDLHAVSDDIRYVNYVSGEWWLPNRPQQLLARREGDCDDKAMLLITLLKSIGITAEEVMCKRARPRSRRFCDLNMSPHRCSITASRSCPAFSSQARPAQLPPEHFWTRRAPESRLGPLPSMDARAVALKMNAGPAEIVSMPASSPADHGSNVNWTITLKPDGSGDLSGEEEHTGDGAFWLRNILTEEGARQEYVRDNLLGAWFSVHGRRQGDRFQRRFTGGRAIVKYKAHSNVIARHEDSDLFRAAFTERNDDVAARAAREPHVAGELAAAASRRAIKREPSK